ncbi:hypothetical protein L6654_34660 [Bradyrhizobium sp. WYCCWR 13023]|uniref:Uncharacterized protein n=1 Tax=Bradyrhizobium zhengyangense TaxID=2911009 RepID=A0A9X1UE94_9BRAD|nr:hypothetical protein [Bradyrhizobium zhengyangense]MCG2631783.1 hypothetical protein [Bradyrhizobium zhengyangense]
MGLKMPAYAYYSARGHGSVRDDEDGGWNLKSQQKLDKFFNFVAHPLVREIGLNQVIYNNHQDLREIDWRARTIFEVDIDYRPRLAELTDVMGKHGTMVVPAMSHLTDGNAYCRRVIDRFCDCVIAPVSVADIENRIDRLEPYLRRPLPELRRTPRFRDDVELLFQEAANSGVNNRDQLKNYLAHKPKELA